MLNVAAISDPYNFKGSTIAFNAPVNGGVADAAGVTINGNLTLGNSASMGQTNAINSLSVFQNASLGGNVISANGANFTGAVTLTNNVQILDGGSGITTFTNSINGAFNLTINSGTTTFNSFIGVTTPLTQLTMMGNPGAVANFFGGAAFVKTSGPTLFNTIVNIDLTSGGFLDFFGSTTTFNKAVNDLHTFFQYNAIEIKHDLVVSNTGSIGQTAGQVPRSLFVFGNSSLGGNITTTLFQDYSGPVTLTNTINNTSTSDSINYFSTLDGAFGLTVKIFS